MLVGIEPPGLRGIDRITLSLRVGDNGLEHFLPAQPPFTAGLPDDLSLESEAEEPVPARFLTIERDQNRVRSRNRPDAKVAVARNDAHDKPLCRSIQQVVCRPTWYDEVAQRQADGARSR